MCRSNWKRPRLCLIRGEALRKLTGSGQTACPNLDARSQNQVARECDKLSARWLCRFLVQCAQSRKRSECDHLTVPVSSPPLSAGQYGLPTLGRVPDQTGFDGGSRCCRSANSSQFYPHFDPFCVCASITLHFSPWIFLSLAIRF